jgi:5-carboxymethyl-2-hydroxymuconate isomerase
VIFPAGVRMLATSLAAAAGADDGPEADADNAHVQFWLKIAPGRSAQVRSRTVDELFAVLERAFAPVMACRPVGFQLDVRQFDRAVTRSGGSVAGSARYGVVVGLETLPLQRSSELRTLAETRAVVEAADRSNGGVILDAWHCSGPERSCSSSANGHPSAQSRSSEHQRTAVGQGVLRPARRQRQRPARSISQSRNMLVSSAGSAGSGDRFGGVGLVVAPAGLPVAISLESRYLYQQLMIASRFAIVAHAAGTSPASR